MRAGSALWKEMSPLAATFPPWGFSQPCQSPVNPHCFWDPLVVDNPGMSQLWEAQGGAKAADPSRSSRFVFPLPEDALGEPLQIALGFPTVRRARGAFGEAINGWQPAALPTATGEGRRWD